jgi:hypothetical protein
VKWTVGALAAAIAVAGCGGDSEESPQAAVTPAQPEAAAAAPAQPEQKGKPRPAGARALDEVVTSKELPADFPADIPRYPGAEVKNSRISPKVGISVVMATQDPADQVFQFLADQLAAEGWSTDIRDTPDGRMILADKGERTTVTQVTSAKDGGTRIRVLVTQFAR